MTDPYLTPDDRGIDEAEKTREQEMAEMSGWLKDVLDDAAYNFPHLQESEIKEAIREWAEK